MKRTRKAAMWDLRDLFGNIPQSILAIPCPAASTRDDQQGQSELEMERAIDSILAGD